MVWANNFTLNKSKKRSCCSHFMTRTLSKVLAKHHCSQLSLPPGLPLARCPPLLPTCCTCSRLLSPVQQLCQKAQAPIAYLLPSHWQGAILLCFFSPFSSQVESRHRGKNTMGPLSAVPNSHSCRNSALIWCENHLNNNLSGSNIGFFMWFFDKSDAAMSLACIWIKIRWHFKKKSLWKRYNNRDLYKNMHSSLSSDTENSKCSYSK